MARSRRYEDEDAEEEEEEEEEDLDEAEEEDDEDDAGGRGGGRKRRAFDFIDDAAVEDEDEDEEEDFGGRRGKHRKMSGSQFFELEAAVDSDEDDEEEEEGEDDFIVDGGAELRDEEDRTMHRRPSILMQPEDQLDVDELRQRLHDRYAKSSHIEYGEEATDVEQQALLPSVKDPKLWMVKCMMGHEREAAICLMQKYIDKGSELHIRSAIALDHLKNFIYVEADKEAHVKEACKGLRNIFSQKVQLVPIKEMTDVLSVESKSVDLTRDTWVRMKIGIYKGDLAKVVDVDNVRQRVTIKLIPRIDLQTISNKLEGRDVGKKRTFVPPPRFFNIDEAREMHIRVERRRDSNTGEYFEMVDNMAFKDGFLYKSVSFKSISTQNIQPTFDELEKFRKPGDDADGDLASLSTLFANRKKGHFMKGDAVIVIHGDLKNLMGWVEKVEEENVHIRPKMLGLPKTLAFNEKELCKYFKPGDHVKVTSGVQEGTTGMVVKVESHVLIILSDTTKEHIRVFADNVVESSEVTSGVTKIGDYELHDLVLLDNMSFGVIIRVEKEACQVLKGIPDKPEVVLVKLREIKNKIERRVNAQDRYKNMISTKDIVRVLEGPSKGRQGPVEHIHRGILFIHDRHHLEHAGFICAKSQSCVVVGGSHGNRDRSDSLGSRFSDLRSSLLQSPMRPSPGRPPIAGGRGRGGRGHDALVGRAIKIRLGPYKGYRGRVTEVTGELVRIELDSQMKIVTVKRDQIADTASVATPYRETPRHGLGSETPMHPSRTPLHPYMTPMRDPGATPIHDGMRTPMRDRAWNPYAPMSPARLFRMPRATKTSSRGSLGHEGHKAPISSKRLMPHLGPPRITVGNLPSPDRGLSIVASGPLPEEESGGGVVDVSLIVRHGRHYRYERPTGYPRHFPLDEYLFPFIQNFIPEGIEEDDVHLAAERCRLERAILAGRDSMLGSCATSFPSFPLGFIRQLQFPCESQLGFFYKEADCYTKVRLFTSASWRLSGKHKVISNSASGCFLLPSGTQFASDGYDKLCLIDRIMSGSAPSWYDRWFVISSHRFCLGATEWLMGVLHHYGRLLEHIGIRHAVTAALYGYPCYSGLLQALAECFNRRYNTFATAEGETTLDLWSFYRISGLPISGHPYEEVSLSDLHRNYSTGSGEYGLPLNFRYLMKVWRDLAHFGKRKAPCASSGAVRVSLNAWVRYFYNGPFCFYECFAEDDKALNQYHQLILHSQENKRHLAASEDEGWNPRRLSDQIYLAAYLVYWLATFVVPYGEEGLVRPELIYPACLLANGHRLALAPVALCNIYHGLGNLTSHSSLRDRGVFMATHYLSAWAGLLLPSLCQRVNVENPVVPRLFLFRNRPSQSPLEHLTGARRLLSYVPTQGEEGLPLAHSSYGFRPLVTEDADGISYGLPHHSSRSLVFYEEWLYCIRPSVLVFRKGNTTFLEPYYPHRFARNFGYDQSIPPDADFGLEGRICRSHDTHLVAGCWWDYFFRGVPQQQCTIPGSTQIGQIDMYYARWWFKHTNVFWQPPRKLKEAEEVRLGRTDLPPLMIDNSFLYSQFTRVTRAVRDFHSQWEAKNGPITLDWRPYNGVIRPLRRLAEDSSKQSKDLKDQKVYFWWPHFLLDCGYAPNAAKDTELVVEGFRNELWPQWENHLIGSIMRIGPLEHISLIENGKTLQDLWDAIAHAGKVVGLPPERVVLQPTFSPAPEASFVAQSVLDNGKRASSVLKRSRPTEGESSSWKASRSRFKEATPRGRSQASSTVDKGKGLPSINEDISANVGGDDDCELQDWDFADDYNPVSGASPPFSSGGATNDAPFGGVVGADDGVTFPEGEGDLGTNEDPLDLLDPSLIVSLREFTALLDSEMNKSLPAFSGSASIDRGGIADHSEGPTEIHTRQSPGAEFLRGGGEDKTAPCDLMTTQFADDIAVENYPVLGSCEVGALGNETGIGDDHLTRDIPALTLMEGERVRPEGESPLASGSTIPLDDVGDRVDIYGGLGATGSPYGDQDVGLDDPLLHRADGTDPTSLVGLTEEEATPLLADGAMGTVPEVTQRREIVEEPVSLSLHEKGASSADHGGERTSLALDFPAHGVEWPDGPQPVSFLGAEFMLSTLMSGARTLFQQEPLPSIDAIRDALQNGTRAYHVLGLPREAWMTAMDNTWAEFRGLYEASTWKSHNLEIQELKRSIAALSDEADSLHLEVESLKDRHVALEGQAAEHRTHALQLQEAAQTLMAKADVQLEEARQLQVKEAALNEKESDLQHEIEKMEARVTHLMRGMPRQV